MQNYQNTNYLNRITKQELIVKNPQNLINNEALSINNIKYSTPHIINKCNNKLDMNSNSILKFEKLTSRFVIFSNLFCSKSKAKDSSLNMYIHIKSKLIQRYLNVSNLIRLNNEVSYLKCLLVKEESDLDHYDDLIKIISINRNDGNYLDHNRKIDITRNQEKLKELEKYLKFS